MCVGILKKSLCRAQKEMTKVSEHGSFMNESCSPFLGK